MTARSWRAPRPLSRRGVLRAGTLAAITVPVAACTSGYQEGPDPLLPLLEQARSDAHTASALTGSAPAGRVAAVRSAHAEALRSEVDRQNSPKPERPVPPAEGGEGLDGLGTRLAASVRQATDLLPSLPGYRAGLVGSVVGGCAALQELAPELGAGKQEDPPVQPVQTGKLTPEAVDAVQRALAAEHAAVWVYGLVSAFLPDNFAAGADAGTAEHTARRDACERLLTAQSANPVSAEAAYVPPRPVSDAKSAQSVVGTAEADTAAAWRAVLDRTEDPALRGLAIRALTNSARRGTRWRLAAGEEPAVVPLPGTTT